MLYLTCSMIPSVDLARLGVSRAKGLGIRKMCTKDNAIYERRKSLICYSITVFCQFCMKRNFRAFNNIKIVRTCQFNTAITDILFPFKPPVHSLHCRI